MLEELKNAVFEANIALEKYNLSMLGWGNVSGIDRRSGFVVMRPADTDVSKLTPQKMVVVSLDGNVVGSGKPCPDFNTHLQMYRLFDKIGGITHPYSPYASSFAQAGRSLRPYGTMHADCFGTAVPCTRKLTPSEISGEYEKNTANVIAEALSGLSPERNRAVFVYSHTPFTWDKTPMGSVEIAAVLERVAMMAVYTELLQSSMANTGIRMQDDLLHKHFDRKNRN